MQYTDEEEDECLGDRKHKRNEIQAEITRLQKIEKRNKTPEKEENEIMKPEDKRAKATKINQAKEHSLKEANRRLNQQTYMISIHNALIQTLINR